MHAHTVGVTPDNTVISPLYDDPVAVLGNDVVDRRHLLRVGAWGIAAALIGGCCTADTPHRESRDISPADKLAVLTQIVQHRTQAYARGDLTGWLTGVTEAQRPDAQHAFQVMRAAGVIDLNLGTPQLRGQSYDSSCTYRFAGFDSGLGHAEVQWQLVEDPRIGSWVEIHEPAALPWEEPGAQARRSSTTLVVGSAPAGDLDTLLHDGDQAAAAVARVWGGSAVCPVIWLPRTTRSFARWAGVPHGGGVPAVTVGPILHGRSTGADRIVIDPAVWARLVPEGRRIILTHEATHLAVRRDCLGSRPLWLDEGFSEYVAYHDRAIPEPQIVAALTAQVRSGGVPAEFPASSDFDGPGRAAAYAAGLLACRVLAESVGEDALTRLIRSDLGVDGRSGAFADAVQRATGWSVTAWTRQWQGRVRAVCSWGR
ncbi:hypothetical protein KEM60_02312 [Austwickia sp. TVS 96-490-7B]|uniref:hypothetical protein n=1 Tax=Austwickia sp. TVS 96-490-7B TaxID=2830843 RepID=UPI001C591B98|nr:hypothetical protein [Austwickia sp. TVS 96-490-7B]MBW3086101.1 hypothetical protein [Austwickia sp. TVS 96-490-7B]